MISTNLVHTSAVSIQAIQSNLHQQMGFFRQCTGVSGQAPTCTELFPSMQISKLPSYLAYGRIAMMMATGITIIATICSILGNPILKCFGAKKKTMTLITAICFILSGLLALVAYSWYTNAAMKNYIKIIGAQRNNGGRGGYSQWDLGWGMWIGFCVSSLAILVGAYACNVVRSVESEPEYELQPLSQTKQKNNTNGQSISSRNGYV